MLIIIYDNIIMRTIFSLGNLTQLISVLKGSSNNLPRYKFAQSYYRWLTRYIISRFGIKLTVIIIIISADTLVFSDNGHVF